MTNSTACRIRCLECKRWFPSPIAFEDIDVLDSSILIGNKVLCPRCGKWTDCNKENMHFAERTSDGKMIFRDGEDTN